MILQYIILYIIIFGIDNSSLSDIDNFENDFLTLFRMGAGKKPPPPHQFSPCNFYKCRNQLPKRSDIQFQPFWHTGVKFQVFTQCQFQIIKLQPRPLLIKGGFSCQILVKLRLVITSLIEMLELPTFGHMNKSTI